VNYVVRTKEGELTYPTLAHLQRAARAGLIDPDDEVRREGEATWKKAASISKWGKAPTTPRLPLVRTLLLFIVGPCLALMAIVEGKRRHAPEFMWLGLALAFVVTHFLSRTTGRPKSK
jgi:hypothetical protein